MKFFRYFEYMLKVPFRIHKIYDEIRNVKRQFMSAHNALISAQMAAYIDNPNAMLELSKAFIAPQMIYNTDNALKFLSLVRPFRSPSFKFVRIGGNTDGGYCLLCPPPIKSNSSPKVVSLGVSEYSPFDLEMADMGYEVLEYDASIKSSPYPKHPNIKFFKKFVGAVESHDTITLAQIIKDNHFDTNAHNILQCDIEDAEWELLEHIDISIVAKYFPQILFEFHNCYPDDEALTQRRLIILEKINEYFVPIHTHFNHNGGLLFAKNLLFSSLLEVSYLRKDLIPNDATPLKGSATLPGLDYPNIPNYPDIPVIFV
ncbi:hypothetical protein [Helicobacter japonicus]|uniref:hypothetical protein n=1 Tax=Helicobacter japonicus TaxID=425400 RepID=UPI0025930018|nr:hypothetical protein [Helicobacter japonicus]